MWREEDKGRTKTSVTHHVPNTEPIVWVRVVLLHQNCLSTSTNMALLLYTLSYLNNMDRSRAVQPKIQPNRGDTHVGDCTSQYGERGSERPKTYGFTATVPPCRSV